MMNKSSSKLIAWLLVMVMIFNIVPVTAFADYSNIEDPVALGNTSEINVTYIENNNESGFGTKIQKGSLATPTFSYWNSQDNQLAGWSEKSDYNGEKNYALFAPGSYINFNLITSDLKQVTLYAIKKWKNPIKFQ